jgi:predicted DNA-binding transcriptional regulator AlpA
MAKESKEPSARDALPDYAERVRRMSDLLAAHALPLADAALLLDVPLSTLDMLRAKGDGPRTFRIGRRLYVRQADLREWIDRMATAEAA